MGYRKTLLSLRGGTTNRFAAEEETAAIPASGKSYPIHCSGTLNPLSSTNSNWENLCVPYLVT